MDENAEIGKLLIEHIDLEKKLTITGFSEETLKGVFRQLADFTILQRQAGILIGLSVEKDDREDVLNKLRKEIEAIKKRMEERPHDSAIEMYKMRFFDR